MEIDLITNDMSEEDPFQVCNDNYNEQDLSTFEEERCGICMDIVIDRGVLDCCQHWFCFACIDNWATITNLCPLCQNEFQLITCVPVYDTTGSNKVEDESRDDDWCIEGKNSSLSFPSYYIDENAVVCLDGDDCKIRSGSKVDDDLNFDTSIACDSCDIWYHAFCVGFDPENTTDSTWLCPRCVVCEMPQRSVTASLQWPSNQCGSANATGESSVEAAFSRKVSVSVADVGETAVVVSMVGGNQWSEEPKMNSLSTPEVDMDQKSESFTPRSDANSSKVETSSNKRRSTEPKMDVQELELSLSHDKSFSLSSKTSVPSECNDNCADKGVKKPDGVDGFRISSRQPFGESGSGIPEMSESDPSINLHLGLSVGSFLSGDHVKIDGIENQAAVGVQQHKPLDESFLLADCIAHHVVVGDVGITSVKRKHTSCSEDVLSRIEDEEIKANLETEISAKKVKTMGKIQMISSMDHAVKSERRDLEKEDAICDIMSIVQDTDRRPLKGLSSPITTDKSSKEREAGLRVKKIMRRAARDKESSIIVQKLRKEIREAIRNKSSIDFGKKLFDPKLLAAFRTAVAGPGTEPAKKTAHLVVKAKKSMLQKGKSRENLTKKIYGINGRRKRAWDRECEVEFWKHRCMRTTKPEKIETLKSVLDVLRNNSENGEIEQQSGLHTANPILSRLYLADTSVFPRKDDIKPLAALKVAGKAEVNEKQHISVEKQNTSVEKAFLINQLLKMPGTMNVSTKAGLPLFDTEKKESVSCLKGNAASSKVNLNRSSGVPSHSGSKVNAQKEVVVKTDDIKSDKRKWALQVLARKTAVAGRNATQEKHEDSAVLKGNYPLLAQLPVDMRPVLAPTRQNKVPISIRQAQLNRLTEHFLRKANQPVIHRTAETELAVADAVNIEKEVADRSNSKLVYVNLCSQELLRRSSNSNTDRDVESDPSPPSAVSTDRSEQGTSNLSIDPDAEEALRNAGLLSDSPPNSPHEEMKDGDEDDSTKTIEEGPDNIFEIDDKVNDGDADNPSKKIEEGPENIFEIDSHPELDIYGDFEYDLEDEDYIGASAINVSKLQSEEESTRMKVVFSTLSSDRPNNVPICDNSEGVRISEILKDSSSLLKCQTPDTEFKFSNMEGRVDESCRPSEPLPGEGVEELSLEECEELYGPDKEPLIERFAGASEKQYKPVGTEALAEDRTLESDEKYASNQVRASELGSQSYVETHIVATTDHNSTGGRTSPNNSQTSENVQRENKSNADSNKQSDNGSSVSKKVEAYIKEHLRPLCKSGVISVEQYRRAVAKTTDKVMKYHSKDKNASFLIKEGEKVKKLAEQYVEAAQQKEK